METETPNLASSMLEGATISISGEPVVGEATFPPPTQTSYPVYLHPLRIGNSVTDENSFFPDSGDLDDEELVAAFRYDTDGMVQLEVFSSLITVYALGGPLKGVRTNVRVSKPGSERFYMLLMQDIGLELKGETNNITFQYRLPQQQAKHSLPVSSPSLFRPPHIQVAHSMSLHESAGGNGLSTPTLPMSALTERKVYETPAIKARHIDPNSSPRPRPQSPTSTTKRAVIRETHSGLMRGGENTTQASDVLMSDSDDEGVKSTMEPIQLEDLDGIFATPENETSSPNNEMPTAPMPLAKGSSTPSETRSPVPLVKTPPRSRSPMIGSNTPSKYSEGMVIDKPDLENHPDSLPDVFKYREQQLQKTHTPAKTYGRKKTGIRLSSESKSGSNRTSPLSAGQKRSLAGAKRKSLDSEHEDDIESRAGSREALKKRKGDDGTPVPTPLPSKMTGAAGSGKPKIYEANDDTSNTNIEDPVSVGITKKSGKKLSSASKKEASKPKPKTAKEQKSSTQESSSLKNNTQYTIPSASEDDPTPLPPKTPKVRTKAVPKKTPGTKAGRTVTEPDGVGGDSAPNPSPELSNLRTTDRYEGPVPKIAFTNSSIPDDKPAQRFVKSSGAKQVSSTALAACNFLVVGPGELKRTPKFVVAIARGIRIVVEQWILDSKTAGYWVDPDPYVPEDPEREKLWQFKLAQAIERGRDNESKVLTGKTVYLTTSLVAQLKSNKSEDGLVEMLNAAGTQSIIKKSPRGEKEENTLVLGKEDGDKDISQLTDSGWEIFTTTVVSMSVLRGSLQEGDEFKIKSDASAEEKEPPKKRGRGKK